jgi:hypothetical protein
MVRTAKKNASTRAGDHVDLLLPARGKKRNGPDVDPDGSICLVLFG